MGTRAQSKENSSMPSIGGTGIGEARQLLHAIVHPRCTVAGCRHDNVGSDVGTVAPSTELPASRLSLNMSAALLHLVADVLRVVTILIVAIAIEVGSVSDPGKADAACAILVAVFVAVGSAEIFRRAWRSLVVVLKRSTLVFNFRTHAATSAVARGRGPEMEMSGS